MTGTDRDSLRAVRRIFGPPGTGKTTELAHRVGVTVAERGGDGIRIASFSKTAATEIGSRDEVKRALPVGAVGTMHHHAYAAIDNPTMALDPDAIKGWNEMVGPTWRITGQRGGGRGFESRDLGGGAGAGDANTGDALLEQLDLLRCTRVRPSDWPTPLRGFARRWTDWKTEAGVVDFADMIIRALQQARAGQPMPGDPHLIVVDEAQDMTSVEIDLALAWGRHLDPDAGGRLVFALDDDQAIMEWRGGDPQRILALDLLDDGPYRQSEVLSQSHRVPPAVHAVAQQWIERIAERYPKAYRPRATTDHDAGPAHAHGWAHRVGYSIDHPQLLDQIEADLSAPDLDNGLPCTVMVIATCGYMLNNLVTGLRKRGIPFHNPFRLSEAAWNPLGNPGRGKSTAARIYRYAVVNGADLGEHARRWTGEDMRMWTDLINSREAKLAHGAKKAIENLPDGTVPDELLVNLWADSEAGDEAIARATRGDLDWLADVITDARRSKVAAFPLEVARLRGAHAIVERPRVVVGTYHSTKGAQASQVYLAPDVSAAGMRQWQDSTAGRDQLIRLAYVGMTRAYHGLTVLAPTSRNTISPTELIPAELEVRP